MNEFIASLIPGQLCNVESNPTRKPFMRVVTKVERVTKHGRAWIRWHWVPGDAEPPSTVAPRGMVDSGYSGIEIKAREPKCTCCDFDGHGDCLKHA